MAGKKGKSGGARTGTGRTSMSKRNNNKRIPVSDQIHDLLTKYSIGLGLSRSDIVESLCLLYLDKHNKDIEHCSKCESPIFFDFVQGSVIGKVDVTCKDCNTVTTIETGEEDDRVRLEPTVIMTADQFDLKSLNPSEIIKVTIN